MQASRGEKRAVMRNAALNYLQLREDFDALCVDAAIPYYGKEKSEVQKFAEIIGEYMYSKSIQGGTSYSSDDRFISVSYRGNYGELLKSFIDGLDLDKSNIKYELNELTDFIGFNFDDTDVTTVSQPAEVTTTSTSVTTLLTTVKGDANCDGTVDMADIVLIMQALANPNKYGENGTDEHHITPQGKANADMDNDGLTVGDAQSIQQVLLGVSKKADIKYESVVDWHSGDIKSDVWEACSGNGSSGVIKNTDELKAYLEQIYRESVISEYLEKYNDSFFSDNILFLDSINQPEGLGAGYKIDKVEFTDNEINISVKNTIDGGECIITLCLGQIIIPKSAYNDQKVNWTVKYERLNQES